MNHQNVFVDLAYETYRQIDEERTKKMFMPDIKNSDADIAFLVFSWQTDYSDANKMTIREEYLFHSGAYDSAAKTFWEVIDNEAEFLEENNFPESINLVGVVFFDVASQTVPVSVEIRPIYDQ